MKRTILRYAAALLLTFGAFTYGHAQETRPAPAKAADTKASPGNGTFITPKTANTQNLAKAEQEDEEYVFKHSASVRAFGNLFHLSPDAASMWFWFLNFLILAVFVGYFIVKLLPKTFRARTEGIAKQLVEARSATEQANRRLAAVEERLGHLDAEIATIRAGAERDSAQDEQHIKASVQEELAKIVRSAEGEIAAAGAAAERNLRTFAAELAVERASSRIHLTESEDRQLIRQFASGMGLDGRSPGSRNGGQS